MVSIYRKGGTYSYFDSNVAFVEGLTTLDGLISVVDKSVNLAGYKVEEEGFLVEHFDITKAHDQLTATERERGFNAPYPHRASLTWFNRSKAWCY